ncbi:MAG: YjfB family protein [Clostridiales bacterium]|jgi:EAL domain-containing protein (putative c-di-GMP-specific phosphodiesterase class I)|nr:YjfB family protein [Clostridiales bacterium]
MDVMGIARLSTQMAQANLMNEISIRVLDNAMEQMRLQSEMMADLLQSVNMAPVGFDGTGMMLDVMT